MYKDKNGNIRSQEGIILMAKEEYTHSLEVRNLETERIRNKVVREVSKVYLFPSR